MRGKRIWSTWQQGCLAAEREDRNNLEDCWQQLAVEHFLRWPDKADTGEGN